MNITTAKKLAKLIQAIYPQSRISFTASKYGGKAIHLSSGGYDTYLETEDAALDYIRIHQD